MSAQNAFSLLNETEGSDTSYRTIRLTYQLHLTAGMPWTETLKEDFAAETDTVAPVEEVEEVVEVVEEKPQQKKAKKAKKPQPKKKVEEDLDAILKEMGVEIQEEDNTAKAEDNTVKADVGDSQLIELGGKRKTNKKNVSKAAAIIANESAQRKSNKKKGKK